VLTIDNPAANTWDTESLPALRDLVLALNAPRYLRAGAHRRRRKVLFRRRGPEAVRRRRPGGAGEMARLFGEAFETLADFRGVSIAAINGFAMGGGLEVAMACDIRIAEQQAKLALPEARVGLLPCAGGTQRLAQLVGEGWAKRMILCNERIDAATAERIGLVEEVVHARARPWRGPGLAEQAAQQSPSAVARCKRLIHSARDKAIADGLAAERELFVELFSHRGSARGRQRLPREARTGVEKCLSRRTGPHQRHAAGVQARPPDPEQPEDAQFPDPGDGRPAAGCPRCLAR
jgi:enoyl-CoA hydratase/carnithine racemase